MLTAKCATSCRSEEERVELLEPDGVDGEEVVGQEGRPCWSRQPAAERRREQAIRGLPAWTPGLALEDANLCDGEGVPRTGGWPRSGSGRGGDRGAGGRSRRGGPGA